MTRRIAIVGVGGQGRECLDIAEAISASGAALEVIGFFDDAPSADNLALVRARGYEVLGGFSEVEDLDGVAVCLGIGTGPRRAEMDVDLLASGIESPVLVHPSATVGSQVTFQPGSVVFAGARLTTNIKVGRHVHVNQNATVGHDCSLEDYVTVNPVAAVSGQVQIGRAATIGAGSVVLQGLRVGQSSTVGAGACVVRDVLDGATVKGVPAS